MEKYTANIKGVLIESSSWPEFVRLVEMIRNQNESVKNDTKEYLTENKN